MTRMEQRYVVLLREKPTQIWLAYDGGGRIGNARHDQAWKYFTHLSAVIALRRERHFHAWPQAKILGTLVEVDG